MTELLKLVDLDKREDFLKPIPGFFGTGPDDTPVEVNAKRWVLYPVYAIDWSYPQPADVYGIKSAKNMLWRKVYVGIPNGPRYYLDDPYLAVTGIISNKMGWSILEYYMEFAILSSMTDDGKVDKIELWRYVAGHSGFWRRARFMWTIALLLSMGLLTYSVSEEAEKAWVEVEKWAGEEGAREWEKMDEYIRSVEETELKKRK